MRGYNGDTYKNITKQMADKSKLTIVVATDSLKCGIHTQFDMVIHASLPSYNPSSEVDSHFGLQNCHRELASRTARTETLETPGKAVYMFDKRADRSAAPFLIKLLSKDGVAIPWFLEMAYRALHKNPRRRRYGHV